MKTEKITAIPQNDSFENEDLPEDWIEVPLSKILLTLESGSRPKGGVRGIETGIPSVGGEHLNDRGGFRFENIKYIPMSFFENMRRGRIQTDDILIVKDGATTGKVSLVRSDFPYNPAMVNEHVFVCRFIEGIYSPFVFYFLFSQIGQNRILENFQGSAQGGINQTFAENTIIPIAPYHEQQRIVARVEALLMQVNAARERLNRVPLIMKKFRQAVLAAACSGRLTEGWREEKPDGIESIDLGESNSILPYNLDTIDALPNGWESVNLKKVATCRLGKMLDKIKNQGTLTPYIRNVNVRWFEFDLSDIKEIKIEEHERDTYSLRRDDILICEGGEPGRCAIWSGSDKEYIFQKALHRVRVGNNILPEYLCFCLKDAANSGRLSTLFTGTTIKHLTGVSLKQFQFPLPPLAEQHEIVRRVGLLFKRADAFEQDVAAAGRRCERLTQAVLGKAFAGKL